MSALNLIALRHRSLVALLSLAIIAWLTVTSVHAHRPHDNIMDVAISPAFDSDGTAFAIVSDSHLRVTRDQGDSWQFLINGLDNVHFFSSLAVSPDFARDGAVLAASRGDGIYRSTDGGHSWHKANRGLEGLDIRKVAWSPNAGIDLMAFAADAAGKVYHSTDGAQSWNSVLQNPSGIHALAPLLVDGDIHLLVGDGSGVLRRFDGKGWNDLVAEPKWGAITSFAFSPTYPADATYWVGTANNGVLRTQDNGASFTSCGEPLENDHVTDLALLSLPGQSVRLYASTWRQALFQSEDGGDTWQKFDQGLSTDHQADEPDFRLPHFGRIGLSPSAILLAGFDGLFHSRDKGKSWHQLQTWPIGYLSRLAVSPHSEGVRTQGFVAYGGGAYLIGDTTADEWGEQASSLTLAGEKGKRTDSGISDVVFSPGFAEDETILAATEHELIRSTDGGKNWQRVNIIKPLKFRLRKKIDYYLRKMGASAATRLKLAGFFPLIPGWSTYVAISPSYAQDGTVFFSTQGLGQCRSTDAGSSCAVVLDTALKMTTSMAISPEFKNDGTLFIGVRGEGVYKTTDGGSHFKPVAGELPLEGSLKLAVSPVFGDDQTVLLGTGGGLHLSTDGGQGWEQIGGDDLPAQGTILAVALSPVFGEDRTIFVAVKGYGAFKSKDAGRSFDSIGKQVLRSNNQLKQFVFSGAYARDSTIYGISSEKAYRSSDGGLNWDPMPLPHRYEDAQDAILYEGEWAVVTGGGYSDSTETRSAIPGNRATLRFFGTGIRLIGHRAPTAGQLKVFIDGKSFETVPLQSETAQPAQPVFSVTSLSRASHEIVVEVTDSGNEGQWVAIDAFEVLP